MVERTALLLGALFFFGCSSDGGSTAPDGGSLDGTKMDGPVIAYIDWRLPPDALPTSCKNGEQDVGESDIDCGGGNCPLCGDGKSCVGAENCASGVCTNNACQAPTCNDEVKNGGETGKDCGGTSDCGPCPDGEACVSGPDCKSLVCTNNSCQAPTCSDGVENGDESDLDCGGHCGPTCALGKKCGPDDGQADCESRFCVDTRCALASSCQALRDGGVLTDGIYTLDINGPPDSDAVPTFCDMTTDGRGWTALAANGEIATAETVDANDCYPLISDDPGAGCGDSSSLLNDFTLPGAQQAALRWQRLLAVAYGGGGYGAKLAYFAIDFGSAAPTSEERVAGTAYTPSPLSTTHGLMRCTSTTYPSMRIVHYTKAGTYNDVAAYVGNRKGTIFGHDSVADMTTSARFTFGFTDTSVHADGQINGVDDYQDGWSCGDLWVPQAVRGQRMVVLVN